MPPKKLTIPTFTSEKQEAAWWRKHRAEVESTLRQSLRQRKTLSITEVLAAVKPKPALTPVTLRLPADDLATARQLAADKGIGYQTYIKLVLHDALRREAARK